MKTALITGASSGIGKATAVAFAEAGINLIICGRRKEALEILQQQLRLKVKVHLLQFDISKKKEVAEALEGLPTEFRNIDILVNNAGIHRRAPLARRSCRPPRGTPAARPCRTPGSAARPS